MNTDDAPCPLFEINRAALDAIELSEVVATYDEMSDAGLIVAPFDEFAVRVSLRGLEALIARWHPPLKRLKDADDEAVFYSFFRLQPVGNMVAVQTTKFYIVINGQVKLFWPSPFVVDLQVEHIRGACSWAFQILLVLLATKNTEKVVVQNSRKSASKKARDDAKHFSHTTILKIGTIDKTYTNRGDGARGPVRAHLRRGHVRKQRIGEGRKDVKTIFIQPVFVNADSGWIDTRKKYKFVA